jgi:hypothetical protein
VVAVLVGDALRRHGIRAVLTGGACASLHSGGTYTSRDVDYVLLVETKLGTLDTAMNSMGFRRNGDRYQSPDSPYYVEFPAGPLAIGEDRALRPIRVRRGRAMALALSATDSCRDRLAAFFHWNDRQALRVAVSIALRNRIAMRRLKAWSEAEGSAVGYTRFADALKRARMRRRRARP